MSRLPAVIVAAACLIAVTACKKDADKSGQGAATAAVASAQVVVLVDGKEVATVDPGRAAQYPPIGAMLPAGARDPQSWATIEVAPRTGEPRPIGTDEQTGRIAALYAEPGGIGFGMFTPEELSRKARPTLAVSGVAEVRVTLKKKVAGGAGDSGGGGGDHEHTDERPRPTADLKIKIRSAAGEVEFTGDKLEAIPTVTAPIGDTETQGWTIPAILEASGVKPVGRLFIEGEEGASLLLEESDLDPAKVMLYVKLNRQGQLRFRIFRKTGEVWDVGGELRGIYSIEVR